MFRGHDTATVDDKGRLKIPTVFNGVLNEVCGRDWDFFVTSLEGEAVRIYPLSVWIKIEDGLAPVRGEQEQNRLKRQLLERANYWGQTARADKQGRVLIPALLRESSGLQGVVNVVGLVDYLNVTTVQRKHESMVQPLSEKEKEGLDNLGIR